VWAAKASDEAHAALPAFGVGLKVVRREPDKGEVEDLTREFLAESQEGLERMEACLTELEKRPDDDELVAEIFRTVHTIKGTTGFLGFGRLERLAHMGENLLGELRVHKLAVSTELINGLLELMDGLNRILQTIEVRGTEGERSSDDDCELIARLEELKAGGGELASDGESASQSRDPFDKLRASSGQVAGRPVQSSGQDAGQPALPAVACDVAVAAGSSMQDKTLRINVDVLNRMMNLVGDLVLTRNQILRSAPGAENFPELARRLDIVTAELRESVMQARMQPVGYLFRKFPRMVRDLAATCGRQIRIEFEGQETGLDKSLLEAVRDPLTHAVRNAVDHGIEPAQERVKAGKPAEGVVRLRAYHQSGSVVIEVTDDGAGISTERVLAEAMERGLVTPELAASMSQREALQLIFVSGFSTTKQVTSVSGRGMGMDVVRTNVEKVGGSVELESQPGSGTTVRMRVPLTLAIIPALVLRSGGQNFALPQNSLTELVYVPQREAEQSVERMGTTELYRLREGLLPLVWLDRLLALEQGAHAEGHDFYIAVVESEGCRFGLVVDDLKAPEEIVVKPLSSELREIGVFSGATVLGNGTLALILDVAAIAARAGVRPVAEEARVAGAEQPQAEAAQRELALIEMESSMVIYETGGNGGEEDVESGRMAMPLSAVERIETVPLCEIEYAGGRAVLQYRGELIPLEDDDNVLRALARAEAAASAVAAASAGNAAKDGATATVLICLRPEAHGVRRVGMVVRRVLDVSAGRLLAADAAASGEQLAMVKNHVTTVHRGFAQMAGGPQLANLKEVA
jgi:two-component system chemotaxis sensor kinase CheA